MKICNLSDFEVIAESFLDSPSRPSMDLDELLHDDEHNIFLEIEVKNGFFHGRCSSWSLILNGSRVTVERINYSVLSDSSSKELEIEIRDFLLPLAGLGLEV
ncbi:hypothetical protein CDAR_315031 [Caerostris darwini]|uniref:Uncharacterized protein n=1 Tax=Caerostris darwini TaxID=1538125 RepID=A0AAV4TUR2_9ARAC|nr:hypothetical protein CDAR_315031 [Caerostris darwini]